jgi:hypothetical protein
MDGHVPAVRLPPRGQWVLLAAVGRQGRGLEGRGTPSATPPAPRAPTAAGTQTTIDVGRPGADRCAGTCDPMARVPLDNTIQSGDLRVLAGSGGVRVFVDQAAQDGSSMDPCGVEVGHGAAGGVTICVGGHAERCPGAAWPCCSAVDTPRGRRAGAPGRGSASGPGPRGAGCRRGARRSRSSGVPGRR